jgi:hypothetical protein
VAALVAGAEFKRRQAAPGLKITDRAFGTGWRMPLASRPAHLSPPQKRHRGAAPKPGQRKKKAPRTCGAACNGRRPRPVAAAAPGGLSDAQAV